MGYYCGFFFGQRDTSVFFFLVDTSVFEKKKVPQIAWMSENL